LFFAFLNLQIFFEYENHNKVSAHTVPNIQPVIIANFGPFHSEHANFFNNTKVWMRLFAPTSVTKSKDEKRATLTFI
jgi:hypothetical protein